MVTTLHVNELKSKRASGDGPLVRTLAQQSSSARRVHPLRSFALTSCNPYWAGRPICRPPNAHGKKHEEKDGVAREEQALRSFTKH